VVVERLQERRLVQAMGIVDDALRKYQQVAAGGLGKSAKL
jgi:hypothetical protein